MEHLNYPYYIQKRDDDGDDDDADDDDDVADEVIEREIDYEENSPYP